MTTLRTITEVYCAADDHPCIQADSCTECGVLICRDHSTEFTMCVDDPNRLHHVGCSMDCPDCAGAAAEDAAEERHERLLREARWTL